MIRTYIKWNPTVEDLDDPNVMLLDREPLLQEQHRNDHVKGILIMQKAIAKIETKLTEIKKQQIDETTNLNQLREKRARLFVEDSTKHSKQIAKLDADIDKLRTFITGLPDIITVLEKQLQTAKAKYAAEARNELLDKQKEVTKLCKELSKQLVAQLKVAVETNQKLQVVYRQYQNLYELTKIDFLGAMFAEPSLGLLEYLFGFLDGELNKGLHCRRSSSGGLPPL